MMKPFVLSQLILGSGLRFVVGYCGDDGEGRPLKKDICSECVKKQHHNNHIITNTVALYHRETHGYI